ncbi:MAG: addiction module protein [Gammaproteobacteria bacterium]
MDIKQIEAEAFALLPEERATLARRLLWSLEEIPESEYDRLWGEESARRVAELDAGTVKLVPGEEVARQARALLR